MRFEAVCNVTLDECMINGAIFEKDGKELFLDRDTTYFDVGGGILDMEWRDCYLWDGDGADYDITPEMFDGAKFKRFDIEDDAPAGYDVTMIEYSIS